jgi:DNA invertase Pin-like site-specific DNA recombinase
MFRFATFAAVSSDPQAREDKASLDDQVLTARAAAVAQGGVETAGPFVIDGYSRTGYVNLSDAIEEIPPLAEAIRAAEQDLYDVLVMDNIERMGDLAPMLSTLFKRHKKQLHSARQSGRVHDPDTYDPTADEAGDIMIHVEGIIQKYRLNKLRRGWNLGVPKRIDRGLPPFRVPFGYDRVNKDLPPVQNQYAPSVIRMKDWLLQGRPLSWIAEELRRAQVPPPRSKTGRWHVESIRHILLNPFYAGIVAMGQKKREAGKKGRVYRQRTAPSEWRRGAGGHEALWEEETLLSIQNEFARRMGLKNYAKTVYPLAGLFRCRVCEQKLIRRNVGRQGTLRPGLGCKHGEAHVIIEYDRAIELLAPELKAEFQKMREAPIPLDEQRRRLGVELDSLRDARAQIQEGWQNKIFSTEEASLKIRDLELTERTTELELATLERTQQVRSEFRTLGAEMAHLSVEELCTWITYDDPAIVNRMLSTLFVTAWLTPEHKISIDWRE